MLVLPDANLQRELMAIPVRRVATLARVRPLGAPAHRVREDTRLAMPEVPSRLGRVIASLTHLAYHAPSMQIAQLVRITRTVRRVPIIPTVLLGLTTPIVLRGLTVQTARHLRVTRENPAAMKASHPDLERRNRT